MTHSRLWSALTGAIFCALLSLLHGGEATGTPPAAVEPLHVLFIGNSYTYVNNLPAMLEELVAVNGEARPLRATMVAFGGATLEAHWQKGDAQRALTSGRWDYVVLQEQSLLPTVQPDKMFSYGRQFNTLIRRSGAQMILFVTWARAGQPAMQEALDRAYGTLAKDLGARLAPVGPAWRRALAGSAHLKLHQADGSHPTMLGTYLGAAVFYCVIYGHPPRQCPARLAGPSAADAAMMQQIAWETVGGS